VFTRVKEMLIKKNNLTGKLNPILGDPGAVSGGRKKSTWARKNSHKKFARISSRPFRLFPAPTNCPCVSEDD